MGFDRMRAGRRLRERLGTARRVWCESGARATAFLAVRALRPLGVHAEWVAVLSRPAGPAGEVPAGFRWAGPADLDLLAGLGEDRRVLRARLARGDRAAVVIDGGRVIAYAWYRRSGDRGPGLRFAIERAAAWGHDVQVAPSHRGRGVARALLDRASSDLGAEGVARVVSTVDALDRVALRLAARRGARNLGTVLVVGFAGLTARREAWAGRRPRWAFDAGPGLVLVPAPDPARRPARRGHAGARMRS